MKAGRRQKGSRDPAPLTFEAVRELAGELPGAAEGTSYGTPAFRVGGKLFVRQHDNGESLVIRIDHDQRAMRMRAAPEIYYITDHYLNYPWMLVRLSAVDRDDLRDLLEDAWRLVAPQRFLSAKASDRRDKDNKRGSSRRPRNTQ
jgi:hypothetical protein